MKNLFLLCLSILLMTSFTACLLEDEECLDSGNCDTQVDEADSTGFNDSLVACYQIYAPVCGNGQTFSNDCYAEVNGVTDYTEGECSNKDSVDVNDTIDFNDSLKICPAIAILPPRCGLNETPVYQEDGNGCETRVICELKEQCEPIVEVELMDCASGLVPRLTQDDQGCFQNQCVSADPICSRNLEIKTLSIMPVEPSVCEEIYDEEGCYLTTKCQ